MLSGTRILITGATGRLGAAMAPRVEELGGTVMPLVLPGYPPVPRTVPWTAAAAPIPVNGPGDLDGLPTPDLAVHLHWRVDRTRPDREQVKNELEWNVHGPGFLWSWLQERGVPRFAFVSSIRVFGGAQAGSIDRATEPRPDSPYGTAKLAGERFFTGFFEGSRTGVVHLRLSSVCSVGEHPTHLVSRLYAGAFEGTRIRLNVDHVVHLLHVDEAVDLVLSGAMHAGAGSYLVAGPPATVGEVADRFEQVTGRRVDAERAGSGNAAPDLVSDRDALTVEWVRTRTLEEGIRRIVAERTGSGGSAGGGG